MKIEIFTDGACSGNPGPAGIGAVLYSEDKVVSQISESIGETTNNIAEYKAIIAALKEAKRLGADTIVLHTDSQLAYRQIVGLYQCYEPTLQELLIEAKSLLSQFHGNIENIPRTENKVADKLARAGVKAK